MNFICVNTCDNTNYRLFKTDKIYHFRKGNLYEYDFNTYGKGAIRTPDYGYRGIVTNEFVKENFIPEYEANFIINELDKLYDNIWNLQL